jgi:predicted esterase
MQILNRTSVAAMMALAAALALSPALPAQTAGAAAFPAGRFTERIVSTADATRSYALYLPSTYQAGKTWPVLFLMDPRGRALVPLELFREAAERHGWVLMSSYNTLSDADSAAAANDRSLDAMFVDAQERFGADPRRLYLGGFSGTARHAWGVALQLSGDLAGIIGAGAAFPDPTHDWKAALNKLQPFAYFGAVGDLDFNHDEMIATDTLLGQTPHPHRLTVFPGPHGWPPKEVTAEAVDWMQLQAMKTGRAPRDEAWIDAQLAARLARAKALEDSGAAVDALAEYRALAADFDGLRDVAEPGARRDALALDPAVRAATARRDSLAWVAKVYAQRVNVVLAAVRRGDALPLPRALDALDVDRLRRKSADRGDALGAKAAERLLEAAFLWTAVYEPRRYIEARDFSRALELLRIAQRIRPNDPGVCYSLARALGQVGQTERGIDALACAVDAGFLPASTVEGDRLLNPLRGHPRFPEIAARAPRG